jgi:hypothetical protein
MKAGIWESETIASPDVTTSVVMVYPRNQPRYAMAASTTAASRKGSMARSPCIVSVKHQRVDRVQRHHQGHRLDRASPVGRQPDPHGKQQEQEAGEGKEGHREGARRRPDGKQLAHRLVPVAEAGVARRDENVGEGIEDRAGDAAGQQ